jgi:hypothetical protein
MPPMLCLHLAAWKLGLPVGVLSCVAVTFVWFVSCLIARCPGSTTHTLPLHPHPSLHMYHPHTTLPQAAGPSSSHAGLEFMDPPRSPFLPQYSVGRASPYGEETWALLTSLAAQGGLCCQQYAATYAQQLGEGFDGYRNASTTVRTAVKGIRVEAALRGVA